VRRVLLAATLLGTPAWAFDPSPAGRLASGQLPFTPPAMEGSKHLGVSPAFVDGVIAGLDLLYERKYKECRAWFADLQKTFPGTGVAPVGDVLVWQAVMLENFDFRFDDAYRAASAQARKELGAAAKVPGGDAWEELMMTVVSGLEAIHAARKGSYLPALTLAFEAIDHVEKTRRLAPGFVDLHLADGLYDYWRTVVTKSVKGMPDFGDKKEQGLSEMQDVVDHGIFLKAPARLSIAFAWIEERQHAKAIAELSANRETYPGNLINELMLGLAKLYAKDLPGALASFDRVLAIDPGNRRAHYYRGLVLLRQGKPVDAEAELRTYLAFDHLEPYQVSSTWYRLGDALYAQKKHGEAYLAYEAAVKTDGDKAAKAAIDRMNKARKEGTISW
jgi:tetratricopeptide (TPR) repeat protein